MTPLEPHIINQDATILQALQKLNHLSGQGMVLFATDQNHKITGSLTDGDIRRALIRGILPTQPLKHALNTHFHSLPDTDPDLTLLRQYRAKGLRLIPLLTPTGQITRILDTTHTHTLLPLTAILMAGGRGERLRPLTDQTPKPLLPIGGQPIIDYNIRALAHAGIRNINVTVNYLAHKLENHFAQPIEGITVKCVRENSPLGTIGSATLVDLPPHGDTLVMNSDLLTSLSFEEMYLHHTRTHAAITIAAIPYNVSVPYAILTTQGQNVTALAEKPSYSYYANAGIYIIRNSLLTALPTHTRTDATDLIEQTIAAGLPVTYFPISGTWIDIGTPTDYAHACELIEHTIEPFHHTTR